MDVTVKLHDEYELDGERYEPTGESFRRINVNEVAVDLQGGCKVFRAYGLTNGFYIPLRRISLPPMPTPDELARMKGPNGKPVELLLEKGKPVCRVPVEGELFDAVRQDGTRFGEVKMFAVYDVYSGRRWLLREIEASPCDGCANDLRRNTGDVGACRINMVPMMGACVHRTVIPATPKRVPYTSADELLGVKFRDKATGERFMVDEQDLDGVGKGVDFLTYVELFDQMVHHAPGTPLDGTPAGREVTA